MTVKIASLRADIEREREGEWIEPKEWPGLDPDNPLGLTQLPGVAIHVRSTNYPPYVTARQKELERLKKDHPGDDIPPDAAADVDGRLAVEHLLLGWRGFDLEWPSPAAAEEMRREDARAMRAMVYWCAARVGRKQVEFVSDGAKNSEGSSGGEPAAKA